MEENSLKSTMNLLTNILNIDPELNDEAYLKQFIKNIAQNLEIKYAKTLCGFRAQYLCIEYSAV